MSQRERRAAPRLAKQLPIILADAAGDMVVQTTNISASGAYCTLTRFLPPMTKLQVRLEVPDNPHHGRIACQGVVVRTEPSTPQPRRRRYDVAIFFSDITEHDRSALAHFVQQHVHTASTHG